MTRETLLASHGLRASLLTPLSPREPEPLVPPRQLLEFRPVRKPALNHCKPFAGNASFGIEVLSGSVLKVLLLGQGLEQVPHGGLRPFH